MLTPFGALVASARVQLRGRWSAAFFVLGIVQPAAFLLVTLLARRPGTHVHASTVALGTGLVSLWGATIWAAGGILRGERFQGTLAGIVARPTSLATVLVGKTVASTLHSALFIGLTVSVVAAAFGDPIAPARPFLFAAALVAVVASAVTLGMLLACLFVLTRSAARIMEALMYPVFILGGLIVPISLLPGWTQPLSWVISLRWGGDLLRCATVGDPLRTRSWLLLAVTTAVYAVAGRLLFRRVLDRARREGTLDLY